MLYQRYHLGHIYIAMILSRVTRPKLRQLCHLRQTSPFLCPFLWMNPDESNFEERLCSLGTTLEVFFLFKSVIDLFTDSLSNFLPQFLYLSCFLRVFYFISWYLLILFFLRQLGWYSYMDSNMLKPVHQHEPVMYRWNTYPSKFLRLFSSVKSLVWSSFQLLSNMYLLYYLTWNIPSRWSCRSFNCFFSTRMEQESRASSVLLRINEYLTVTCINNFNWF